MHPVNLMAVLQVLTDEPGTAPVLPAGLDWETLERNEWVERDGEGWRVTKIAKSTIRRIVRTHQLGK